MWKEEKDRNTAIFRVAKVENVYEPTKLSEERRRKGLKLKVDHKEYEGLGEDVKKQGFLHGEKHQPMAT